MAELSQKEQLALHEFSVRYREALAEKHQTPEESMATVRDAITEQYEQERDTKPDSNTPGPDTDRKPEPPEPDMQ